MPCFLLPFLFRLRSLAEMRAIIVLTNMVWHGGVPHTHSVTQHGGLLRTRHGIA